MPYLAGITRGEDRKAWPCYDTGCFSAQQGGLELLGGEAEDHLEQMQLLSLLCPMSTEKVCRGQFGTLVAAVNQRTPQYRLFCLTNS